MDQQQLYFSSTIGSQKPETIRNKTAACPFCQRDELTDILETKGDIIWLMNKYPTLLDTYQTVIIETNQCHEDIRGYEQKHMRELIRFSIAKWLEVEKTGEYESVILFKNHGPFSGGSIQHAHMQVIGMKHVDYHKNMAMIDFEGTEVYKKSGIELNVSKYPVIGFTEFNLILNTLDEIDDFADKLQILVRYILDGFHRGCTSYNLFFYHFHDLIICKAIPRFVVSPLFVGYKIPQVLMEDRLDIIRNDLSRLLSQT
jgi:ATP adenylyltransferase/5',5'''-P-1,P-4-tetraphosphate phosphorylase II